MQTLRKDPTVPPRRALKSSKIELGIKFGIKSPPQDATG
jgi:hypothetical protein